MVTAARMDVGVMVSAICWLFPKILELSRPDCIAEDSSFIISYCRVVR